MLSLVLHALRARRAQALAMFTLAVLAGLGAAAAPWFLAWGADAAARSAVESAPLTDRVVIGTGTVQLDLGGGSPMDALAATVEEHLPVEGGETNFGARILVSMRPDNSGSPDAESTGEEGSPAVAESIDMDLAIRTGVCDHLRLVEGSCDLGAGEVLLARRAAERLGVGIGDQLRVSGIRLPSAQTLSVGGIYVVADPFSHYWSGTGLLGDDGGRIPAAFVGEQTLLAMQPNSMEMSLHVLLPASALIEPGHGLRDTLDEATVQLSRAGFSMSTPARRLLDRVAEDRRLVVSGVTVGAGQLVLVSWVGLFLAVRHTSDERRGDVGLLKLRGTTTRRVWTMIGLSSGVPMLAGTVVGAAGGFAAAAALAYRMDPEAGPLAVARTTGTDPRQSLWLSLAAAAVAGLGGLVAAVVAEWRTSRAPVVDLLRRVPGGRRGWRADVVDLVVVVIAAAGVYQGWVDARGDGPASALSLLSPLLVGLAVALLAARALPLVSAWAGRSALRAGRAGAALAALQLARRQGTQRVFAVLVVAAAVFTTMTLLSQAASAAWQKRAVQELGADRVLTVDAPNAAALMHTVRSVDPEGRYAMAVASTLGVNSNQRVVAIDTTRYAAVGRMPDGLPSPAALTPMLRPDAAALPEVADGPLTLDATAPDLGVPVGLRVSVWTVDGQHRAVTYPALAPGRHVVEAAVEGCDPTCQLTGIEVLLPPEFAAPEPVTVVIHELRQPDAAVLAGPMLGDITRWRTTLQDVSAPPMLSTSDGQLAITLVSPGGDGTEPDTRVMPLAVPAPLPVAVAGGQLGAGGGTPRITVVGGTEVPVTVAVEIAALPVVGNRGVLVDLEYALRSNDAATESADLSVWLTADTPDSLVAALTEYGVTVLEERSVAQRSRDLAEFGPGLALQFGYFTVVVILLLAAAVALVGSTVDRPGRVAELVALRGQGMPTATVRTAGLAGIAVMVVAAALTGVFAAMIAEGLVTTALPAFADDWRLLSPPPRLTLGAVLISLAVSTVVLGAAAVFGAGRLVAAATTTSGTAAATRSGKGGATRSGKGGAARSGKGGAARHRTSRGRARVDAGGGVA